jgi:hypothetical protein
LKKIISALLMFVLVVPFTAHAGGGQAAGAFADNFMKSYYNAQRNSRENEALQIEREKLELLKKQQENQQQMEQQRQNAEQQKNNLGATKRIIDIDGNDWAGYSEAIKAGYVIGFLSGSYGVIAGNIQKGKDRGSKARNSQLGQYFIGGISPNQIISGLDSLYGDFKNKQIRLIFAVYIVKKQISGGSAEEIESILQYMRTDMTDPSKLNYIDKDGKKKMASLP